MPRSECLSAHPPGPEAEHPISNDPDYWYRQTGPDKFKSTYLKVVGGTTWHWLGTCLRFVPNDFRLKRLRPRCRLADSLWRA
jgi:glucose dehydrogenase